MFLLLKFSFILLLNFKLIHSTCDIFMLNQCPPPPQEPNNQDYCNGVRANVDCLNEKLETCSDFKEYAPALETIKLIFQYTIDRVKLAYLLIE